MSAMLEQIAKSGVVAVIRLKRAEDIIDVCKAVAAGGVTALEITMTTPGALEAIRELTINKIEGSCVGVGTVLTVETAHKAITAGASFVVSPIFKKEIVRATKEAGALALPGAYSPTEIFEAAEADADVVKIFPASVGGPGFLKGVKAVFPDIKIMPTGGVSLDTIAGFVKAGAWALGTGSNLTPQEAIDNKNWTEITAIAKSFVQAVQDVKNEIH